MINLTEKTAPKRKPGRPKKAVSEPSLRDEMQKLRQRHESEERAAQPEAPKEGIFKSKFREDVVELIKPRNETRADGSKFVDPGYNAEFHRNTWNAPDATKAQLMRDKIKARIAEGNPLHIVETTNLD